MLIQHLDANPTSQPPPVLQDTHSKIGTLHKGFTLHTSPHEYALQPNDEPIETSRSLVISRRTGEITLNAPGAPLPVRPDEIEGFQPPPPPKPVDGLLGLISLSITDYLILITSSQSYGQIPSAADPSTEGSTEKEPAADQNVYLASHFTILPLNPDPEILKHPVEKALLGLLHDILMSGKFWYSYGWDLTRRLQAQDAVGKGKGRDGLARWEAADDRFFWNKHLMSRFIQLSKVEPENDVGRFILPMMYGSFDLRATTVNGHPVQLALISRRSKFRAGTRYNTRGVDAQGNVGNFNETEQLLIIPGSAGVAPKILSFVQTRGSAPFHWAEIVNLVFVPHLVVMEQPDSSTAFALHVRNQQSTYGKQMVLNLVKARGREKLIKDAYEKRIEEFNGEEDKREGRVEYEYFDLHNECKNDRWERIDDLVDRLEPYVKEIGYFQNSVEPESQPTKLQSGVIRSNCMDCLDRTNIVQTYIAKRTLVHQLRDLGLLPDDGLVDNEADLLSAFRNMWSDHANFIATAYTGTGALRTDYTRTGIRTKKGVVKDKMTSLIRYMINNHVDGNRQDAFDLFTGAWVPRGGPANARFLVTDNRPLLMRSMKYIWGFALFMIFAGMILPRSNASYPLFYHLFVWFSVFTVSASYMVRNGIHYINWPRLLPQPTQDAIYYSGPGARTGGKRTREGGFSAQHASGEKLQFTEALKAPA